MTTKRKYKVDSMFFNKIDNEEKAYILGFIMADGGIYYSSKNFSRRLYFSINEKDIEILNKIKIAMKSDYPIKKINQINSFGFSKIVKLTINSTDIVHDLIKLKYTNNKTGNEFIPRIEKSLLRHFIRGFFDGDGTIFKSRGYNTVGFTSSLNMLNSINELFSKELNLDVKKIYKESGDKKAYRLYYSQQEEVYKIYNYLYKDSTIYLERKKHKFNDTIDKIKNKKNRIDSINKLRIDLKSFIKENKIKQKDFAKSINVSPL